VFTLLAEFDTHTHLIESYYRHVMYNCSRSIFFIPSGEGLFRRKDPENDWIQDLVAQGGQPPEKTGFWSTATRHFVNCGWEFGCK
jgi:hypothetical protein